MSDTPRMRTLAALPGVLLLVMAAGCSDSQEEPLRTLPTGSPPSVSTDSERVPPSPTPTPTPTCDAFTARKVSKVGAGFIVELNISSGMPNPAWRLSTVEGIELQKLLRTTRRGIDRDGPDEMGGYGVTADRGASVTFLRDLDLPDRFWVRDNKIARFLGGTTPCKAPVS